MKTLLKGGSPSRRSSSPSLPATVLGPGRGPIHATEILGALFNGLFLVIMAGFVLWMGAMRLMEPIELATTPMLLAAFGGIVTELIAIRLLYVRQKDNLNMQGAFWHILQTFVGSFIIIISALVIRFTGFLAVDPLLGMAFGLILFWASWKILRDSINILLEATPDDLDLDAVLEAIRKTDGVTDVHHVHAWSLTSGRNLFSVHVCVHDFARDGPRIQRTLHDLLKYRFNIYFSTMQIEEQCLEDEEGAEAIDNHPQRVASEGYGNCCDALGTRIVTMGTLATPQSISSTGSNSRRLWFFCIFWWGPRWKAPQAGPSRSPGRPSPLQARRVSGTPSSFSMWSGRRCSSTSDRRSWRLCVRATSSSTRPPAI